MSTQGYIHPPASASRHLCCIPHSLSYIHYYLMSRYHFLVPSFTEKHQAPPLPHIPLFSVLWPLITGLLCLVFEAFLPGSHLAVLFSLGNYISALCDLRQDIFQLTAAGPLSYCNKRFLPSVIWRKNGVEKQMQSARSPVKRTAGCTLQIAGSRTPRSPDRSERALFLLGQEDEPVGSLMMKRAKQGTKSQTLDIWRQPPKCINFWHQGMADERGGSPIGGNWSRRMGICWPLVGTEAKLIMLLTTQGPPEDCKLQDAIKSCTLQATTKQIHLLLGTKTNYFLTRINPRWAALFLGLF